jgi:CheY-like chemotaxis protein
MDKKIILMVEDNPDDELLTTRTLNKNNIMNEVVIARDGSEALDFLFGVGAHTDQDMSVMPQVILLDLKLPKIDGLEVLKRIRSDERTKEFPVVIFTSSNEERDLIESYKLGPNSYIRKPMDFTQFAEAVRQLGLNLLVLNEANFLDKVQTDKEETVEVTSSDDQLPLTNITSIPDSYNVLDTNAVSPRLSELISNMSEEEIQELIEELEKRQETKISEKRKHPRKRTFIYVDCVGDTCGFTDFIQNINAGGIFMETSIPLFIDQKLSMSFTLPGTEDSIKIRGNVVRVEPKGVAIQFDEPTLDI